MPPQKAAPRSAGARDSIPGAASTRPLRPTGRCYYSSAGPAPTERTERPAAESPANGTGTPRATPRAARCSPSTARGARVWRFVLCARACARACMCARLRCISNPRARCRLSESRDFPSRAAIYPSHAGIRVARVRRTRSRAISTSQATRIAGSSRHVCVSVCVVCACACGVREEGSEWEGAREGGSEIGREGREREEGEGREGKGQGWNGESAREKKSNTKKKRNRRTYKYI